MNNITIKNANILPGRWRNFSGEPDDFHPKGSRYFNIQLDEESANMLSADGWNVKTKVYDDGTPIYTLQVKINFDSKEPPKIKQITRNNREGTILDSESVRDLDRAYIERADVRISPYEWNVNGKSGITAYLDRLNVVLNEDDFDSIDYFEGEGAEEEYIPFQ
jgi:hypothetical protein